MMRFWLRKEDKNLLGKLCKAELNPYIMDYDEYIVKMYHMSGILTGGLDDNNALGEIGKHFIIGKEGIFVPEGTEGKYHFVRIGNSPVYADGLILTPYSRIDLIFHLKGKGIEERTDLEVAEMEGTDLDDFVERAFRTYYGPRVSKSGINDSHFFLYSTHLENKKGN